MLSKAAMRKFRSVSVFITFICKRGMRGEREGKDRLRGRANCEEAVGEEARPPKSTYSQVGTHLPRISLVYTARIAAINHHRLTRGLFRKTLQTGSLLAP
jgi:hypothetical protein